MTGSLFIITAASGTGKTSLVKQLLATTNDLTVSVSHTTRAPRPGEIDGQHYHFTDVDKFVTAIGEGKFLEHAEVFGNYYGTSEQSVRAQLEAGVDVILEIDWQGALQVKKIFTEATMIFILPPSLATLRQRLSTRAQDSMEVIEQRLAGAAVIFYTGKEYSLSMRELLSLLGQDVGGFAHAIELSFCRKAKVGFLPGGEGPNVADRVGFQNKELP